MRSSNQASSAPIRPECCKTMRTPARLSPPYSTSAMLVNKVKLRSSRSYIDVASPRLCGLYYSTVPAWTLHVSINRWQRTNHPEITSYSTDWPSVAVSATNQSRLFDKRARALAGPLPGELPSSHLTCMKHARRVTPCPSSNDRKLRPPFLL